MEQGAIPAVQDNMPRMVIRVGYAVACKCPGCGQHISGGVEVIVVSRGAEDVEHVNGEYRIHGVDGLVVFDDRKVNWWREQPDRQRR